MELEQIYEFFKTAGEGIVILFVAAAGVVAFFLIESFRKNQNESGSKSKGLDRNEGGNNSGDAGNCDGGG